MVRPGREPEEPGPAEAEEESAPQRGDAFRRALARLPRREGSPPPPLPSAGNGTGNGANHEHGNGNGHTGGAPMKVTTPDEITAPRLEASLAKLLAGGNAVARPGDNPDRSRTLPPPPPTRTPPKKTTKPDRGKTKVTRIVAPRPPTETRTAKLPPLKPTGLVRKPPPKTPPPATPPAGPPRTEAPPTPFPPPPASLGDADTKRAGKREAAVPPVPAMPGDATNEFENLLEGLLESREHAAAIPSAPAPADPPAATPRPDAAAGTFSVDTPMFSGPDAGEGNLSDFVSKILDELDSIVEAPAGPGAVAGAAAGPAGDGSPPPSRETVAWSEDELQEHRAAAQKNSGDTRRSKETGEFEDEPSGPTITPDELSALSDLFNED